MLLLLLLSLLKWPNSYLSRVRGIVSFIIVLRQRTVIMVHVALTIPFCCSLYHGRLNSRFQELIKYRWFMYAYRVKRDCLKCAVLCYTVWALYKVACVAWRFKQFERERNLKAEKARKTSGEGFSVVSLLGSSRFWRSLSRLPPFLTPQFKLLENRQATLAIYQALYGI